MDTYQLITALLKKLAEDSKIENINPEYKLALFDAKEALLALRKFY